MVQLPVTQILPALRAALRERGLAVLQAPPGAGKTTLVPLDLLASGLYPDRILMLEPRRLAARASAERMAEALGESVGQTVGYRIRGDAKTSSQTRIEVVTEGILTRMIQSDAELPGVSCVIFDEFHERSLQADLGLALALEIRSALRPDLALLVMSATLDAAPVAALMGDAPILTAEGRAFPVETRWLPRPTDPSLRFEAAIAGLIRQAIDETAQGGLLAFLPGEGEIRRVEAMLSGLPGCSIRPLFGAMDFAAQRAALAPAEGRKIVLATSIAETSLTLPDIRIVVDGGRARRARFDPASGMSRLVTERVTKAEAEQRRGRAGRVAEGICYRLWSKGEEGALAAFPPPEIAAADLAPLALELAQWGSEALPFLTPPPAAPLAEAKALLTDLGALQLGRITAHGRKLAALPLHPRIGHMLTVAGPAAAPLAALLEERDPLRGAGPDLLLRLKALDRPPAEAHRPTLDRIRLEAKRLARLAPQAEIQGLSPAQQVALAYPDRIGLRRKGDAPRYLLSGGKGAVLPAGSSLAAARLIVASDLDGDPREASIRQAIALPEDEFRALFSTQIQWQEAVSWSRREGKVAARRQESFGALILDDRPWPQAPEEALATAALDGLRQIGLSWTASARRLRARIALARDDSWPEVSDEALLASAEAWLLPYLTKARTEADLRSLDLTPALKALLSWDQQATLDRLAPASFVTPLGRAVPIDYDGDQPGIEIRLQEMFGVTRHPAVGAHQMPLRVTLLSPGQRPVQVTLDLPGFWAKSYADVRKDMRGQYPRHPWPEDPTQAEPTLRAKPRGT
ncbi:ATP-dependent helicase HrpB [Xinfangfangia sp. CPCC 101601]|uniref:ATP-dependent helicase HrpB n=1 Tax=Pseudogemmobacter lacusdianii TaxID=3069608 RepID=A0ABU0VSW7_9RHOB|nr:ATP-dependent helicase HrpB [Xinfangfangia sp. CPCC 101601]MDQ2064824.1 ATP-dependent helicase HrpB [Xinfangfangia sp. CPCC 101601]